MMLQPEFSTLIQSPESRRDSSWELNFLDAMVNRRVSLTQDQPQNGPDGWPYMIVGTNAESEPFAQIVNWCTTRGIGIVVNSHKMVPDYVFTYGMLWYFRETGRFVDPLARIEPPKKFSLPPGALVGTATARYLPPYVRTVVREFLNQQGITQPRILVVSTPDLREVDLCWVGEEFSQLSPTDQSSLADALSWFLPGHYRQVFVDGKELPPTFPL